MKVSINDKDKSGIYVIRNLKNGKVYVGKSKCIYTRMKIHINALNRKDKSENRHLINSWHKYGKESFEYFVIEYLEFDPEKISERELFWQRSFKAKLRKFGYNLRENSSTGMICHPETIKKMKESHRKRYEDPNERRKCSHKFWKNNPDALKKMSEKVAKLNVKYFIEQYDKNTNILIKRWDSIIEIMNSNPEYKKHNIYAVCSGEKPSMYGFTWKKVLK